MKPLGVGYKKWTPKYVNVHVNVHTLALTLWYPNNGAPQSLLLVGVAGFSIRTIPFFFCL
jgi:hypothetical protein